MRLETFIVNAIHPENLRMVYEDIQEQLSDNTLGDRERLEMENICLTDVNHYKYISVHNLDCLAQCCKEYLWKGIVPDQLYNDFARTISDFLYAAAIKCDDDWTRVDFFRKLGDSYLYIECESSDRGWVSEYVTAINIAIGSGLRSTAAELAREILDSGRERYWTHEREEILAELNIN